MRPPDGKKWVIFVTLPESKNKFVIGGHEGSLALIPIGDGTKEMKVSKVLAFDDSKEASKWLKDFLKQMDAKQKENFLKMRPDLGLVAFAQ